MEVDERLASSFRKQTGFIQRVHVFNKDTDQVYLFKMYI